MRVKIFVASNTKQSREVERMSQQSVKITIETKPKSRLMAIYTKLSINELNRAFNELTGEHILFPRYCSFKDENGKTKYADRIVAVITDRAYRALSARHLVGKTSQEGALFTVNDYHIKKDGVIRPNLLPNPDIKQGKNLFVAVPSGIDFSEALSSLTEIISTCREHGLLSHPCEVIIPGGNKVTGQHGSRAIIKPRDVMTMEERVTLYVILRNLDWGYNGKDDQPYLIRCEWAKDEKNGEVILNPTKPTTVRSAIETVKPKTVETQQQDDVHSEESCPSDSSVESIPTFKSVLIESMKTEVKEGDVDRNTPSEARTVEDVEKDIFASSPQQSFPSLNTSSGDVPHMFQQTQLYHQQHIDQTTMIQKQILDAKAELDEAYKRMMNSVQEFQMAKHKYMQVSFSAYHPPAVHVPHHFMIPMSVDVPVFHEIKNGENVSQEHKVVKIRAKQESRPEQATSTPAPLQV